MFFPQELFEYLCRWRKWRVNNSGFYMFAISLSEIKCLQDKIDNLMFLCKSDLRIYAADGMYFLNR